MNRLVALTLGSILMATTPAAAQWLGMGPACSGTQPCIRDARGTIVGMPLAYSNVLRRMSGNWYQFIFTVIPQEKRGPVPNGTFYFETDNCTGQPYLNQTTYIPPITQYDQANHFWAGVGDAEVLEWHTYSYPSLPKDGGTCVTSYVHFCQENPTQCTAALEPASIVQTQSFVWPFTTR